MNSQIEDATIRLMTKNDLPGADRLRQVIGWNQTPEDWLRLFQLEPSGCFVAERQGAIIGTVVTTVYAQELAWIGMMLVHPEHRRRGIARRLMQQAICTLRNRGIACIKLDATPAGLPLYQKLGFVIDWTLTRHQCLRAKLITPTVSRASNTRELAESDWAAIAELDRQCFGAPRGNLLMAFAKDCLRAIVWPAQGPVLGWGLLRRGAHAAYVGPVACRTDEGSHSIIAGLLRDIQSASVFWDVPDENASARTAAQAFGFEPVRPLTRMWLGQKKVFNPPEAQFAIADPAVG